MELAQINLPFGTLIVTDYFKLNCIRSATSLSESRGVLTKISLDRWSDSERNDVIAGNNAIRRGIEKLDRGKIQGGAI